MADAPVVHIGENSPEEVAFKLMQAVGVAENKTISTTYVADTNRKYILDTYAECLEAVKGNRLFRLGSPRPL